MRPKMTYASPRSTISAAFGTGGRGQEHFRMQNRRIQIVVCLEPDHRRRA